MKFRAVLFDLDGTLLDSLEDLADSMNSVLESHSFPCHGLEKYKYFVGEGMENLVRRAMPESAGKDEKMVALCLGAMREEYAKRWIDKTRPYDGVPELLSSLASHGLKLAILSNKPDDFAKKATAKLLAPWRFEAVVGERPPTPRKPDPAGALRIVEQLAIPAHQFLYVGDTSIDMKTGNAAGMFAVGVLWGFRGADELFAAGARVLIEKPLELLELL
jgi:phosphoglycolate phosphatase